MKNHAQGGTMFCAQCGAPNDDAARFCLKCGSSIGPSAPSAPSPPDPRVRGAAPQVVVGERRMATGKNPTVATILSIIPGVGQFYNGDVKKGAIMLGIAVVLGPLTAGVGYLGLVIWSAIDAYRVASGQSALW